MKTCANCGTQCEDHMNFCSNCGSALGEIAEEKPILTEPAIEEEQGIPTAEQIRAEAAGVFEAAGSDAPIENVVVFADKPAEAEAAVKETGEKAAAIAEEAAGEAAEEAGKIAEEAAGEAVEEAGEIAEEALEETAAEAEKTAEEAAAAEEAASEAVEEPAEEKAEAAAEESEAAAEQPVITIEEDNSTVEIPEPQIRDAAEAAADDQAKAAAAAVPAAEKAVKPAKTKKKKGRRRKPISVMAILSMIFSLIGLASGGYACLFTFMDLKTAALFFIPGVLGIVFGLIGIAATGKETGKRGRALAVIGLILGLLSIVLWIVGAFMLRNAVREKYGNTDLMSAIRTLLEKK